MTPLDVDSPLAKLEAELGANWPAIRFAREFTGSAHSKLETSLGNVTPENCSVILTGSLGRWEAHEHSDADWMLLVDGPASSQHAAAAREIAKRVGAEGFRPHGPTGTFGEIVPSHDLVHHIAGSRDSNQNLTRRLLLLSESHAVSNPDVRSRVLRAILHRYAIDDQPVRAPDSAPSPIPHFLVNDVVRYWRTVASDYASKIWERTPEDWALRNVKLRFSRKVLFAGGLLLSFAGKLFTSDSLNEQLSPNEYYQALAGHIQTQTQHTPLDLIALAVSQCAENERRALGEAIFGAYDKFLATTADSKERAVLAKTDAEKAHSCKPYRDLRAASHQFRNGIRELFFEKHSELPLLIRQYGVF